MTSGMIYSVLEDMTKNRHSVTSLQTIFSYVCLLHHSKGDDTLKLWDIRSFKRAVNVATGLQNFFSV